MEEGTGRNDVKKLKNRINSLIEEEDDADLLSVILALLAEENRLRAAAK